MITLPRCKPSRMSPPPQSPNYKHESGSAVFQRKMFVGLTSYFGWEKAKAKGPWLEPCAAASIPSGFGCNVSKPKVSQGCTGDTRAVRSLKRLLNWKPG